MPTSAPPERDYPQAGPAGQPQAIMAQALYIANLLLLPGLAFAALTLVYLRNRRSAPPLAAAHLAQTFSASLWAGILLVCANLLIIILGGYSGAATWTIVIVYFTVCHSALVLLGILGLAKAMAGQCWRFPLVGRPLPAECSQYERFRGLL